MKMTQPAKTEDSVAEFVERNLLLNVENIPRQMIPWYCAHQRMVTAGINIISEESMIYQVVTTESCFARLILEDHFGL